MSGLLGYGSAFSLGGLTGLGGGGFGGLGGFGGAGFGGGFGGHQGGVFRPPHHNQFNDLEVQSDTSGISGGYYKRRHEKQLIDAGQSMAIAITPPPNVFNDHFYEFEKKVLLQDRHRGVGAGNEEPDSNGGYRTFVWKTT